MKYSALFALAFIASITNAETVKPTFNNQNIIMIVADGMANEFPTAYRYFLHNNSNDPIKKTVFDRHLVGTSSTYPHHSSGYVTDSAASATALSSGVKTYNGAIAVDINKQPVTTILEQAKLLGKNTGVVVTSQVNHATPASYLSHNESRNNYNEIADSYIDEKINDQFKADILLGGGTKYFEREDRNLINDYVKQGGYYISEYEALKSLPKNKQVLGLFAKIGLPSNLDDPSKTRLKTMAMAAINHLEHNLTNENGYFLLIEASQIDWAAHNNDIASAIYEVNDLAKTLEYLEQYIATSPNTTIVLTADHGTGGFNLGANKIYAWRPEALAAMQASPTTIAKRIANKNINTEVIQQLLGFTLTNTEIHKLAKAKKKTKATPALTQALLNIIDQRTNTGWTTKGHTATDVPVYAMGAHKALFAGSQDNTEIAKKLFSLLPKK